MGDGVEEHEEDDQGGGEGDGQGPGKGQGARGQEEEAQRAGELLQTSGESKFQAVVLDYRVLHLVEDNLLLTLKYELGFSIRSLYCGRIFNLMSTNNVPRPDGRPFTYGVELVRK